MKTTNAFNYGLFIIVVGLMMTSCSKENLEMADIEDDITRSYDQVSEGELDALTIAHFTKPAKEDTDKANRDEKSVNENGGNTEERSPEDLILPEELFIEIKTEECKYKEGVKLSFEVHENYPIESLGEKYEVTWFMDGKKVSAKEEINSCNCGQRVSIIVHDLVSDMIGEASTDLAPCGISQTSTGIDLNN